MVGLLNQLHWGWVGQWWTSFPLEGAYAHTQKSPIRSYPFES